MVSKPKPTFGENAPCLKDFMH